MDDGRAERFACFVEAHLENLGLNVLFDFLIRVVALLQPVVQLVVAAAHNKHAVNVITFGNDSSTVIVND